MKRLDILQNEYIGGKISHGEYIRKINKVFKKQAIKFHPLTESLYAFYKLNNQNYRN